ncbi:hypothetical protein BTN50_0371 [Candidatus Enterovibrio altilux]|uniref:Uncharacterized protein n=1 Tax=Candidatus Enterovibrio altilux TaxID=1927128 RepID=A0A291B7C7_9GAMM|nr:hypothetical protein BTN50_0371 [Candidatus Enterovibrio luxaltus]
MSLLTSNPFKASHLVINPKIAELHRSQGSLLYSTNYRNHLTATMD